MMSTAGSQTQDTERRDGLPKGRGLKLYLLGVEHRGIVVGIENLHYSHCCGGGAVPVHVRGLDGQCVLGDFLGEKEHR